MQHAVQHLSPLLADKAAANRQQLGKSWDLQTLISLLTRNEAVYQTATVQVAWQMLGVPQLNAELRSPVTEAELQAQALSDKGRLTNDNAAALLPPFEVDMGIAAAGQGPRVFWVGLSNEGQLPLQWELHSYDTPVVR
jgi:hypothetical protein